MSVRYWTEFSRWAGSDGKMPRIDMNRQKKRSKTVTKYPGLSYRGRAFLFSWECLPNI
jgi:hypothetical protein